MLLLLYILFLYSLVARISHWLSIWQQKEYRLDRLQAFLSSADGRAELFTFINFPISLNGFRRPKPSPKAASIFFCTLILLFFSESSNIINLAVIYLLSPAYVLVASIPAWAITFAINHYYQHQTKLLLAKHKPRVIGITGSYGKTTTKFILAHFLRSQLKVWVSPASFNHPLSLCKSFLATYQGEAIIIVEYAAYHRGEISILTRIFPPDLAIITGLTYQHLATFKSFSNIVKAKSELLQALPSDAIIYYNDSDRKVVEMVKAFSKHTLVPTSRCSLTKPQLTSEGLLSFTFSGRKVITPLLGFHYLSNLQLALLVAQDFHISINKLTKAIANFSPTGNFILSHKLKSGGILIDDGHTCNPEGFLAALKLLSHFDQHYKVIISPGIIDLGSQAGSTHFTLGKKASSIVDQFIHTSPLAHIELKQTLKNKYIPVSNLSLFQSLIRGYPASTVILIEGRIPKVFQQFLFSL